MVHALDGFIWYVFTRWSRLAILQILLVLDAASVAELLAGAGTRTSPLDLRLRQESIAEAIGSRWETRGWSKFRNVTFRSKTYRKPVARIGFIKRL